MGNKLSRRVSMYCLQEETIPEKLETGDNPRLTSYENVDTGRRNRRRIGSQETPLVCNVNEDTPHEHSQTNVQDMCKQSSVVVRSKTDQDQCSCPVQYRHSTGPRRRSVLGSLAPDGSVSYAKEVRHLKKKYEKMPLYDTASSDTDCESPTQSEISETVITILKCKCQDLTTLSLDQEKHRHVEEIDISYNRLTELSPDILGLRNLRILVLDENEIVVFPVELMHVKTLEVLSLKRQHGRKASLIARPMKSLCTIPIEIGINCKLKELYLSQNTIMEVPNSLQQLQNLRVLDLSANMLQRLPTCICNIKTLQYLGLSGNDITSVPHDIQRLQQLKVLRLAANGLRSLPDSICRLSNLVTLSLRRNKLQALPLDFDQLVQLRNPGTNAGHEFALMPANHLEYTEGLHLEENPLIFPPVDIVRQGVKAVFSYIQTMRQNPSVLQEILKNCKHRESRELSIGYLNDKFLHQVAGQVGLKWEQLAAMLDVTSVECEKIKMDHAGNSHQQIFMMLRRWRTTLNAELEPKIAIRQLGNGLRAVGHSDTAAFVEEFTTP